MVYGWCYYAGIGNDVEYHHFLRYMGRGVVSVGNIEGMGHGVTEASFNPWRDGPFVLPVKTTGRFFLDAQYGVTIS